MRAPLFTFALCCCLGIVAAQASRPTAPPGSAPVLRHERLRAIVEREVRTEAEAEARRKDAATWLAERAQDSVDPPLRWIASFYAAKKDETAAPTSLLVDWLRERNPKPPAAPGLEAALTQMLTMHAVRLGDAGSWDEARRDLPLMLMHARDHRGLYWLLGRRARDHGSESGKAFLNGLLTDEILRDPVLDDADRVYLLRRFREIEYTGPRTFVPVAGQGLDGKPIDSSAYRGKVLLVDFWASWCVPCVAELPNVVAAHAKFAPMGLAVLGVSLDGEAAREKARALLEKHGATWPQLFEGQDWKSPSAQNNKVLAIPATILIDRSGRVRYTNLTGKELHDRIAELLAE